MKTTSVLVTSLLLAVLFAFQTPVIAQSYWDQNGTDASAATNSAGGGSGTWGAGANWWVSGNADTTWNPGNIAYFWGSAGTVTLGSAETADGLSFGATGYTIAGSTLTLGGAMPTVSLSTNVTNTISSVLAGTNGLTFSGAGTLVQTGNTTYNGADIGTVILSGVNTYTGGTTINGCAVQIGAITALGPTSPTDSPITLSGGGAIHTTAGITDNGPITLGPGGGTIIQGSSLTLTGTISGPGNLTCTGNDFILQPSGNNSMRSLTDGGPQRFFISSPGALGVAPNLVTVYMLSESGAGAYLEFQDNATSNPQNLMYFGTNTSLTARAVGGYSSLTVSTTNAFFPPMGTMYFNRDSGSSAQPTGPITINGNYPNLTGNLTINFGGGSSANVTGSVTLNGVISDTNASGVSQGYSLTVASQNPNSYGNLILNGTNSYSGGTTNNAGLLTIGPNGDLGDNGLGTGGKYAGPIYMAATGTIINDSTFSQTLSGSISGPGTFTQNGPGTLIVTGNSSVNPYVFPGTGVVAINGGVLQLGDGSANNGSLTENITITSPGELTFRIPPATSPQSISNTISGSGNILMNQAGAVEILAGLVSAPTVISAGTLQISGSLSGSSVSIEAGTLFQPLPSSSTPNSSLCILPGGVFDESLADPYTFTSSAKLCATGTLGSPAKLNGASGGTINLDCVIAVPYDGTDVPLTITWGNGSGTPGTVILSSATGSASFLVTNLTASPLAPGSYPLFTINGTLSVSGSFPATFPASVAGAGVTVGQEAVVQVNSGGAVSLVVETPPSYTWNGGDFNSNPNWSEALNWIGNSAPNTAGDNVTFAGTSGLAPYMDQPYGINTLSISNNAGAFTLTGAGGVLSIGGGVSDSSTSPQTINTPVLLTGGTSPWAITNTAAASITVGAPVADQGGGLTLTGSGTLTLLGYNTFTGGFSSSSGSTVNITGDLGDNGSSAGSYPGAIIDNGTFTYSGPNPQTFSGPITVGTNGTFTDSYSGSQTFSGAISIESGGTFTLSATTFTIPLTVSSPTIVNNGAIVLNSFLQNVSLPGLISGTGSLSHTALASTLTLANAGNTYSGGTTINGNTLTVISIGAESALGTGPLTFANGAGLKTTASVTDYRTNVLLPGSSSGTAGTITIGGSFTEAGCFTGGGGLSEGGNDFIIETPAGTNNDIGTLTETANRLFINTPGALGGTVTPATVNVTGTALLIFQSNAPAAPVNSMTFASGTGLTARDTGTYTSLTVNTTNVTFPSSGTILYNYDQDSTPTGPLIINGNYPTLTGNLIVQMGGASSGGGLGTIGNATLNGAISDNGAGWSLTKTAPSSSLGNLILNGLNTYSGNTTNVAGGLTIGANGDLGDTGSGSGSYAGLIVNTGLLTNAASVNQTWSGIISGTGTLNQSGAGTLTLAAVEAYTGATTITAGTLLLGAGASIATSPSISIAAGGTFDVSAVDPFSLGATTLSASGAGTGLGATAAAINDTATGGTINLGSKTINLTITPATFNGDTTHPALLISHGGLVLGGNTIGVNNAAATPLGPGTYTLIHVAGGSITGTLPPTNVVTVSGTGLEGGSASIQVAGGNVNLVVVAPPSPTITSVMVSGTTLTILATNGAPNGKYVLLESTNMALPLTQWTPIVTNSFNSSGNISLSTNIVNSINAEFYVLKQAP